MIRVLGLSSVLAGSLLLAGCSTTATAPPSPVAGAKLRGNVHGGQQAVVGAHVYLFSAATTGYGQPSVSLLQAGVTGSADALGAYVVSGADGSFSISGDYACVPGTQAYLYSLGGNPGGGVNPSAGFMAALGGCPSSGSYLGTTPLILMNEVSTVAAAYAIAGFATDATHVSSSGTPLAQTGIANAFANAANLATLSSGVALAKTPAGNGFVPQTTINSIANILASCVNSSGAITGPANASTCFTLFQNATSDGTPAGTVPSDTATAAINIAHNPGRNTAALYSLATPINVFAPALTLQPNDFTLSVLFQSGGYDGSTSTEIAIDSQGNAWFTNATASTNVINDIVKLSPTGVALSPASGFLGGGLDAPHAIAIDNEDNVWIGNSTYFSGQGSLTKLSNDGTAVAGSPFTGGGLVNPNWLAVDAADNVWVTNNTTVSKLSASGAPISPPAGYTVAGTLGAKSVAIDAAGEVILLDNTGKVIKLTDSATIAPGFPVSINLVVPSLTSAAIDGQGDILVDASNPGSVFKFTNAGAPVSGYPVTIPTGSGGEIVVDGAGSVWIQNHNRINEVSPSGVLLSPTGFLANGSTYGIAVDGSGDVWTTVPGLNAMEEIIGSATPVVTPISAAVKSNRIGSRP